MRMCLYNSCWERALCVARRYFSAIQDAEDCVIEAFLRYRQARGAFPFEEPEPDYSLLTLKVRNVALEHLRMVRRRQSLYSVVGQVLPKEVQPSPEMEVITDLDVQRFIQSLPPRLAGYLHLRLQGYTIQECASRLGVSEGTLKSYLPALRQKFVDYFGYDPTINRCSVVNMGKSQQDGTEISEEVNNHDQSAEIGDTSGFSADNELSIRAACYPAHSRDFITNGGGGGITCFLR